MNLTEIFHEYLSDVYWPGMAADLLQNDVKRYEWEYAEFSRIYSG